jgi:transposase
MGKPYSMDLRKRVVAAIEGGESTHQAAVRFSIGIATAGAWARLKRATGDVRSAKEENAK